MRDTWRLSGRVQGVGFRWFVRQAARSNGVCGDVKNLPDGRVEVRAEGTAQQLERLLDRLRVGPAGARVERVERIEADPTVDFQDFEIRT